MKPCTAEYLDIFEEHKQVSKGKIIKKDIMQRSFLLNNPKASIVVAGVRNYCKQLYKVP
jgi:hypothetical protein